jgi:hypothetical protein
LWSFPLGNRYGGVAVSAGYATVNVSGPHGKVQTSGFTDPGITFQANFVHTCLESRHHPDKGVSWIDLYAGGRFFTNNDAFQGNNQLSQHPHYGHNIGKRMWVAIGVHYDNGGQSFINHIPQNDYANGFRPALAISRGFGKFRLTLRYENTASKPHAEPTNSLFSFRVNGPVFPFF